MTISSGHKSIHRLVSFRLIIICYSEFNVVLNGLDNLDARRHVNRLCLAADVPLLESGTTGFLGQLFGDKNQDNDLNVCSSDVANSSKNVDDIFEHNDDEVIAQYERRIFDHVFGSNIELALSNEETLEELGSVNLKKKKFESFKKPLDLAEELEKKNASTGLHLEEGAAA
ncbi:hypothetical protein KIW84_015726 [Lathyrus oleraceus]|uniref:THIF-type NAD/FAD binding fold domain-containing protein n=1 Tax=Pisum sativum TaxID=3888 RepID=A0A9D5BR31_PEA|nr:hypothetical protein KIW84_015726 [Pisum sativum]